MSPPLSLNVSVSRRIHHGGVPAVAMAKDPSASVIPRSLSPAVQVRYLVLVLDQMRQTLSRVHDFHCHPSWIQAILCLHRFEIVKLAAASRRGGLVNVKLLYWYRDPFWSSPLLLQEAWLHIRGSRIAPFLGHLSTNMVRRRLTE